MSWNYADLTKKASMVGGPEAYVELLIESGRRSGRKEMLPAVLLATCVGYGIFKVVDHYKKEKKVADTFTENAKQELIKGMTECNRNNANHENNNGEAMEKANSTSYILKRLMGKESSHVDFD